MQLKTKNGITLIALVVTIIVLLILAGVSINIVLNNNGIFKKAQDAGVEMEKAALKERIETLIVNWKADEIISGVTEERFWKDLEDAGIIEDATAIGDPDSTTTENGVKKDTYIIETTDDYDVEIIVTEDEKGNINITVGNIEPNSSTIPKVSITELTSTETSITVKVSTKRMEGGTLTYSYREKGTTNWTEWTDTETSSTQTSKTEITITTGIEKDKIYEIKVYAQNNGESKEVTKEISTDKTAPQDATATFDKTEVEVGDKVTATVTLKDAGVGVDVSKSKYVFKKSNTAITNESEFTNTFSSLTGTIEFTPTEAGDWYLQVLTVDKGGNKKITVISQKISVTNKVTGISLNKTTAEIGEGETLQLTATITPENASNKEITWSSNSTSVATVSQTGLVTAVGKGETTITATAADGSGVTASCILTVTSKFTFTGTTNTSDSYVGCYADINGDGYITEEDDGIIFADLLKGGSGTWNPSGNSRYSSDGTYSIGTISSAKSYKVSSSNYTEGKFESAKVLQANGSGADRFYVMALKDLDTNGHCWYFSAYNNNGISDYNTVTSLNFGTGKTNTSTMITKWNGTAYGSQNGDSSYTDVWGVVQIKYAQGWFVPSRAEWAAFGDAFNITSSNYSRTYGLSNFYWSSSLSNEKYAWGANFGSGYMNGYSISDIYPLRLCTTF